ncbi:hypothetical protein H0H92_013685 [Tricholoma furcatifolium]|nr:hypothetical protein H0H92_013685 [Tricholoma furcatifolium]
MSEAPVGVVSTPEQTTTATIQAYDFGFLPIPRRLRYDPEKPFQFGLLLNIVFGLSSTFTLTRSLSVIEALSYLVGVFTVTPMVLLPLAVDVVAPKLQSTVISTILAGLLFGILLARVFAGIVGQYALWRSAYYLSIGLQYLVLAATYFIIPDYPAKNKEPLRLIQSCLICILTSACFTTFWVTLTFLLGGPPYNYSTLVIGLFGLVGMLGIAAGPLVSRAASGLVPWYTSLLSIVALILVQAIQVGAGGISIGAVIVVAFGIDTFRQSLQVSISIAVFT